MNRQAPLTRGSYGFQSEPSTSSTPSRQELSSNYFNINPYTLSSMARRLESLLTEQMSEFTAIQARPPPPPTTYSTPSMVDLGEQFLATRLFMCAVRVDRLWGK